MISGARSEVVLDLDRSTGVGIAFDDKVLSENAAAAFELAGSGQLSRSRFGFFILILPRINFETANGTTSETKGQRAAL